MCNRILGTILVACAIAGASAGSASAVTTLSPIVPGAGYEMLYPKGVGFDPGGGGTPAGVWVTDVGNFSSADRVYKYKPDASSGTPLQIITSPLSWSGGGSAGGFSYPAGVVADGSSHSVFLADAANDRVVKLNTSGLATAQSPAGVDNPHSMKLVGSTLYVADLGNHRVRKIDANLAAWSAGTFASSDFMTGPSDVAVDPATGRVWAPDEGDRAGEVDPGVPAGAVGRVLEFASDGSKTRTITNAAFGQPYGAEWDALARVVYVGDYTKDKIFVLDADDGSILGSFGSMVAPVSMALDPTSRVLFVGSVGTRVWHGPGARVVNRFQLDSPVNCSGNPTVAANTAVPITFVLSCNRTPQKFKLLTQPAHGTLSGFNPATGAVTYKSNNGYAGPDSFTFEAVDAAGHSQPATRSIVVSGPPPPTPPTGPTPTAPTGPTPTAPTGPTPTAPTGPTPAPPGPQPPTIDNLGEQPVAAAVFARPSVRIGRLGRRSFLLRGTVTLGVPVCGGAAGVSLQIGKKIVAQTTRHLQTHGGVCSASFTLRVAARHHGKRARLIVNGSGTTVSNSRLVRLK